MVLVRSIFAQLSQHVRRYLELVPLVVAFASQQMLEIAALRIEVVRVFKSARLAATARKALPVPDRVVAGLVLVFRLTRVVMNYCQEDCSD